MTEHRRLLEEDLARLVTQTNDSINHRRELLARIEDRLSTVIGPLALYRIYLLGDQGNILLRKDVHARSNADAVQAAWHWLDAEGVDRTGEARGVEVWRGRRLISSSHHKHLAGKASAGTHSGSSASACAVA